MKNGLKDMVKSHSVERITKLLKEEMWDEYIAGKGEWCAGDCCQR